MKTIDNITILFLNLYQKYLSPYKGYKCAYGYYTGKQSCSEFSKKCVIKYGSFKAITLTFKHLNKCNDIYYIESKKEKKKVDLANECSGVCGCL